MAAENGLDEPLTAFWYPCWFLAWGETQGLGEVKVRPQPSAVHPSPKQCRPTIHKLAGSPTTWLLSMALKLVPMPRPSRLTGAWEMR